MPVEGLQRRVAAPLEPNRSRQPFVGGSTVFDATFPRRSEDRDVDAHVPIGEVAARDAATLRGAGLTVEVDDRFYGFSVEAVVGDGADATTVEWNEADRERFLPVVEDDVFGWILHRSDLAVQKLIAAASRRKPRDAVDVLLVDMLHAPVHPRGAGRVETPRSLRDSDSAPAPRGPVAMSARWVRSRPVRLLHRLSGGPPPPQSGGGSAHDAGRLDPSPCNGGGGPPAGWWRRRTG